MASISGDLLEMSLAPVYSTITNEIRDKLRAFVEKLLAGLRVYAKKEKEEFLRRVYAVYTGLLERLLSVFNIAFASKKEVVISLLQKLDEDENVLNTQDIYLLISRVQRMVSDLIVDICKSGLDPSPKSLGVIARDVISKLYFCMDLSELEEIYPEIISGEAEFELHLEFLPEMLECDISVNDDFWKSLGEILLKTRSYAELKARFNSEEFMGLLTQLTSKESQQEYEAKIGKEGPQAVFDEVIGKLCNVLSK
jgi:hypothetical protein